MRKDKTATADDFLAFMKQKGMNTTTQRRIIAETFFSLPGHHSLEEFYNIISQKDPSIGQTTVYRTLKLLCESGLALEIHFSDDITRYEIANPTSHHDHLVCLKCGKIEEIYDPAIEKWQKDIAKARGFILKGHVHNLYGICESCREEMKNEL